MAKPGGQPGARLPKGPSPQKARQMLKDDSANGEPLSKKQKGFFGSIVGRSKGK